MRKHKLRHAAEVSRRIRSSAGKDALVDEIVDLYREAVEEVQAALAELLADGQVERVLRRGVPQYRVPDAARATNRPLPHLTR